MSGGHWDYSGSRLQDTLNTIAEDGAVQKRFPHLARTLRSIGDTLYQVEHDIDWDLSHDTPIHNDKVFETMALLQLMKDIKVPYELEKLLR